MTSELPRVDPPRRVGRPARIDRDSIARAVIDIGFEDATMKRVAEHLGVSVPGLYYYVRGRDDLLRLAAEYSLARTPLPVDEGQHWAGWLREWAQYTRAAMAEPELMDHYVSGDLDGDRMVDVIGSALDVLFRDGFSAEDALAAWAAISSVALGSAVNDLRQRESTAAGRPWVAQLHANLATRGVDEHPTLRALLEAGEADASEEAFDEQVTTMLIGLAVRFGRPIDDDVRGTLTVPSPPAPKRRR